MASPSIDDLTAPLETEEIKESIYSTLAVTGTSTTLWKPGAVTRTIIAIVAVVLHALSVLVSRIARSGFAPLAAGEWLAQKALYDFAVEKQFATFAAGSVLVSNSSGVAVPLAPDALELECSVTRKRYRNTTAAVIGALATNTPVAVRAVEAGSASSALPGEVDRVVSAHPTLSVTNTETLIGLDDEADPELQGRCAAKLEPFSPDGPAEVYDYIARNAKRANGSRIGVTRTRCVLGPMGRIDVYCATTAGAVAPADLAVIDEAIQTQAVPLTVTEFTHSASELPIDVTYRAWAVNTTGLREDQLLQAIQETLAAYFTRVPIGGDVAPGESGKVYLSDIGAEISRAKTSDGASLRVFKVIVDLPDGDVPLAVNQVPVLGAVSGQIVRVPPPRGAL